MLHKISNVKPLQNMLLFVEFRDGTELIYNAGDLPAQNEIFNELKNPELFAQVKVDSGGYGISWNDDIDLDGEEIWANGTVVKEALLISPGCSCPTCGQKIRQRSEAQANASRANLAKRTHKGGRPINPNSKRQQMLAKKTCA